MLYKCEADIGARGAGETRTAFVGMALETATQAVTKKTTMDTLYLTIHMDIAKAVVALFGNCFDCVQDICTALHCSELILTAYISVLHANLNECVSVELNCRSCLDGDLLVFQKPPLNDKLFVTNMLNTARLVVVCVTPFNWKKAESRCWAL